MAFPSFFMSSVFAPSLFLSLFIIVSSFFMLSLWAADSPTTPASPKTTPTTAITLARPRLPVRFSMRILLQESNPDLLPAAWTLRARQSSQRCQIFGGSCVRPGRPRPRESESLDDVVRAGGGLSEAAHRERRQSPVDLVQPEIDLSIRQGEEPPALVIALDQERAELDRNRPGGEKFSDRLLADDARSLRLVREAQDVGRVALVVGDDEVPVARVDRDRRGVDLELVDALREVLLEVARSEEHTSELQSLAYLVCRLLLEKKKSETQEQRISPS